MSFCVGFKIDTLSHLNLQNRYSVVCIRLYFNVLNCITTDTAHPFYRACCIAVDTVHLYDIHIVRYSFVSVLKTLRARESLKMFSTLSITLRHNPSHSLSLSSFVSNLYFKMLVVLDASPRSSPDEAVVDEEAVAKVVCIDERQGTLA